ncbi:MAG: T9SS type A sorting domain-containing protein, partial [Bacteroidota bacterium]
AISNNTAGQPTGFDLEFWNDSTNAWDPQKSRYSGVTWNAGFDSWFATLGSDNYMPNAEDFLREGFKDLPRVSYTPLVGFPDQYLVQEFNGTTFMNSERAYSVVSGGLIQRVTNQTWTGTGWESDTRDVYTWTGTKLTMATSEDSSSGSWQSSSWAYRDLWAYNGNGDLTSETTESRDSVGAPWLLAYGNQYAIVYQPTNASRIQKWLEKDYNRFGGPTGSGAWDTLARYTLYYSTTSSTCPGCEGDLALGIYPNPFSDQIHINGLSQEAQWCITDLNGRLFARGDQRPEESGTALNIACQAWPAGIYMLQVWDAAGNRSWHRLVKR